MKGLKYFVPRSVKWRTAVFVICGVSIIMISYGIWLSDNLRRASISDRVEQANVLLAASANAISAPLWNFDIAHVEHALTALKFDPDFVAAWVTDPVGEEVASVGQRTEVNSPEFIYLSAIIEHNSADGTEELGQLHYIISKARLDLVVWQSTVTHSLVSGCVLLLILGILYLISLGIARPLRLLRDGIIQLSNGDLEQPVLVPHNLSEISLMADAIEGFRQNALEVQNLRRIKDKAAGEESARVHAAVESTQDAVVILDESGTLVFSNAAAQELVPDLEEDGIHGIICNLSASNSDQILKAIANSEALEIEGQDEHNDKTFAFRLSPITARNGKSLGTTILFADVSERILEQERIARTAKEDTLTQLPNRRTFEEQLSTAVEEGSNFAVMMLDLDHFKNVNDTMGHPVGDKLLIEVASRLNKCAKPDDLVARLGGDEFAIIIKGEDYAHEAVRVARRAIESISRPFLLNDRRIRTGTSIGIVLHNGDQTTAEELIRKADLALYQVKGTGRGQYRLFEESFDIVVRNRQSLEDNLRAAIETGELFLDFQPQREVRTGKIVGFEALARWDPVGETPIGPDQFIPIAEESGLIEPLTEQLFLKAGHIARQLADKGHDQRIALNLSPTLLNLDPVRLLRRVMAETGCTAEMLEIEVTEEVFLSGSDTNKRALGEIRKLGIPVALDDFGTGYSSLGTLQEFQMDRLKIDKCFVSKLDHSDEAQSALPIVRAIVELGHALGMKVTAEGVETQMQLAKLQLAGCDTVQGYLVGRPSPEAYKNQANPALKADQKRLMA
ncbi:MAG: EAL domain-containing protein [Alphaproteobacteria bacterium]|nr:EAL domain-containing protein [Alphaproteobacteria bacterium]